MKLLIIFSLLFFVFFFLFEIILNPSKPLHEVAKITLNLLWDTIKTVLHWIVDLIKDLFRPTKPASAMQRWPGDYLLGQTLHSMVAKVVHPMADIDIMLHKISNVPAIVIYFTPEKTMSPDDVTILARGLLLRFRQFLANMGMKFPTFSSYTITRDFIEIYLFYAELPEDEVPFMNLYRDTTTAPIEEAFGEIYDDELEREFDDED